MRKSIAKIFALFCVILFPFLLLSAKEPPAEFVQAIQRALDGDAKWTMTKKMHSPALTLSSSGKVSCYAGHGIVWQAMEPFMQQIRMTTNTMEFVSELDTKTKSLDELPHYAQIRKQTDLFLQGEAEAFSEVFDWEWKKEKEIWTMSIRPKRSDMRRLVERAVLSGKKTFDEVVLYYPSGDQVHIKFQEDGRSTHSLWK